MRGILNLENQRYVTIQAVKTSELNDALGGPRVTSVILKFHLSAEEFLRSLNLL